MPYPPYPKTPRGVTCPRCGALPHFKCRDTVAQGFYHVERYRALNSSMLTIDRGIVSQTQSS